MNTKATNLGKKTTVTKQKTAQSTKKPAPRAETAAPSKKAAGKRAVKVVDRSAAIARSWQDPAVRAARSERNAVKVNGDLYRSVGAAFVELGLPMGVCIRFRGQLKAAQSGRKVFEHEGTKYSFTIVRQH